MLLHPLLRVPQKHKGNSHSIHTEFLVQTRAGPLLVVSVSTKKYRPNYGGPEEHSAHQTSLICFLKSHLENTPHDSQFLCNYFIILSNDLFEAYTRNNWRKIVPGPCSFFSVHFSLPPQEINHLSLSGCKRKLEFHSNVWSFKRVRADMESNAEVPSGSITFVGNCVGLSIGPITCDNHLNESMKQHKASTIKACWSSSKEINLPFLIHLPSLSLNKLPNSLSRLYLGQCYTFNATKPCCPCTHES